MARLVFPSASLPGLTYPFNRTPMWDTLNEPSVSGKRTRYPQRNLPVYNYKLVFEFLRQDQAYLEWQTLLGFYNQMFGSAYLFSFTDPDDSVATNESFGTGDGASTIFQLTRAGQFNFAEPVFCPTTITNIEIAGTPTAAYTIDMTTGLVTFNSAPANAAALTWTGAFNWYARFDEDKLNFAKFANNFWEAKQITFTTELI